MSDINDGGPAYPCAESHHIASELPWTAGMSIRDMFACHAITGLMATQQYQLSTDITLAAIRAYIVADAMLKARES